MALPKSRAALPNSRSCSTVPTPGLLRVSMALLAGVALVACGADGRRQTNGTDSQPAPDTSLEEWRLSDAPALSIGVREGEEPYQLHRAAGSLRLDDGRVVVANGGSQELRFFDADGRFLFSVGGDGEGPGEFRFPRSVRRAGGDSLLVWDQRLQRASLFDTEGAFLSSWTLNPTPEEMFPGDEWLLGKFLIDSPLPPDAREPLREAVQGIPEPDSLAGLAFLKVTRQGRIWSSGKRPPADTALVWTVYGLEGSALARITTPARFELQDIGEDYVLGRFYDELDINYIQLFDLNKPDGSPVGPGLDLTPRAVSPTPPVTRSDEEAEVLALVKSTVKNLASLEEIHYSDHYTYTSDTQALFENPRNRLPEELSVTILFADNTGWMGTVTHAETGIYCALTYGGFVPMGWAPGTVICP